VPRRRGSAFVAAPTSIDGSSPVDAKQ